MIPEVMTLDSGFAFERGRKKAEEHTGLSKWAARASAGASGLLACLVAIFPPSSRSPDAVCQWGLSFPGSGGGPGCCEAALGARSASGGGEGFECASGS